MKVFTTYYLLLTAHYSLLTTYYLRVTTYYLLLTTYYLRFTTYYLLLITYYSPPESFRLRQFWIQRTVSDYQTCTTAG